jgi:hypothetical protein
MTDPGDPTDGTDIDVAATRVEARRARELRGDVERIDQQLHDVVEQLAVVRSNHADLASTVSEQVAPHLTALGTFINEELAPLKAAVADLLANAQEQEKVKNPPVDWVGMDVETARAEWPKLARWIAEVFVPWYEITRDELPDCWALHRPVVVELSWLATAHRQAYLQQSHPHITAEWHARWRPVVLARLKEALKQTPQCRPGRHQGRGDEQPLVLVEQPGAAARAQLAVSETWWPFYARGYHHDIAERQARQQSDGGAWVPAPPQPH